MVPPKQSNTIDFDAAKLQRLASQPRQPSKRPLDLLELRQQLNLKLQASLEAERILAVFFREMQHLLPVEYLAYHHAGADLHLEFGDSAQHSADYRLTHDSEYLGELCFRRRQRFSEAELVQLESLMACLLYPLRNALLYRAAVQSALRDALTGTGNRIAMDQALTREIEVARRHLQPLSVLMLDLDHFKQINDAYGHSIGDDALRAVATAIKASLRNVDMVFRFGGEEFLVLLSNTPGGSAAQVGERLRRAVEELNLAVDGKRLPLSISLGCATLNGGESVDDLLRRADDALYSAKRDGRNRLAFAS
ncbi:GGDEF domain-containing protein [Pseudomonas sp. ZM23]|uniref:diguanylate cyclase n=1 Tax=Pseudomonas triclosanedens TaxID=2961893 RepID=A0ABY7A2L1_9PSED|nr:GGDEF domain-containing protein [Pseudomonas triclosanedens]MCP8464746.1 GGDEF domain-containing protein [Pseudomonas triclosanedens]MCP8470541.1 GGDEF domain-containing protein [Pseudomonas triclosanedens]MCP8476347.1 GGDEF domain-containing protein [Pseudomonas triclosanedens]WAI51426.1 GGDEF domain-containing protein [Pseudomonas triclosanedens]